jgi:hypothetical protein
LLRRGFKAQSERRSLEVRKGLGIAPNGALDAFCLADHMKVTVWSAKDVPDVPEEDRQHLFGPAADEWSAFTIREDEHHLVVYNPVQSHGRINSVVMHELSHIMLGHDLAEAQVTEGGHFLNGNYDADQEQEADWLGGALLLPRPALLWIRSQGMTNAIASAHYGVSDHMLNWRVRMTGVDYQLRSYP